MVASEAQQRTGQALLNIEGPLVNNFISLFPNITEPELRTINDRFYDHSTAGFIGRFTYDFNRKYLVEFSGRYDGSWKFPKDKRWGFFPSVSAGWRISHEDFFINSGLGDIFSNLKLRASYGQMGDDNIGSAYPDFAFAAGYIYDNPNGAIISSDPLSEHEGSAITGSYPKVPVTNISWIKSSMTNIGLDLGFFENRLSAEIDAFYRLRDGLAATRADVQMPAEVGFNTPAENLNTDKIYGVDGFVKWTQVVEGLKYYVGVNATLARKMTGERYGEIFSNSWEAYRWSAENRWSNANPSSNIWAATVTGQFLTQEEIDNCKVEMDANGNRNVLPGDLIYEDLNGDGRIDNYDNRPLGYEYNRQNAQLPILTYGINLGLEWKNFDFATDLAGASLQTFINDGVTKWPYHFGNSPEYIFTDRWHHEDIFDPSTAWVPGTYPALRKNNPWGTSGGNYRRWNTFYMTNVTYLRLRNIELGYTLSQQLTNKVNISACRIYFSGTNLFSLDNIAYQGLDPEVNEPDGYNYPQTKMMTLGINLTF
jgi:TonB-linked SusC/RagA family outer membrane protein